MKKGKRIHIVIAVLILAAAVLTSILMNRPPEPEEITYNTFLKAVEQGKIEKVYLNEADRLKGVYKDGKTFITDNPRREDLKETLLKKDITVDEMTGQIQGEQVISMAITLSLFGFLIFAVNRNVSKQTQGKFGKSPFNAILPEKTTVNFNSVAGNEEAKESIQDLVDFIKNPEKYARYGARLPRGVIFHGSPGSHRAKKDIS